MQLNKLHIAHIGENVHHKSFVEVITSTNQYKNFGIHNFPFISGRTILNNFSTPRSIERLKFIPKRYTFLVLARQINLRQIPNHITDKLQLTNAKIETSATPSAVVSENTNSEKDSNTMLNSIINVYAIINEGCSLKIIARVNGNTFNGINTVILNLIKRINKVIIITGSSKISAVLKGRFIDETLVKLDPKIYILKNLN